MDTNPSAESMPGKNNLATRDVFINLATMLSLGVAISSLIMLVTTMLDTVWPTEFNCGCDFTSEIINYMVAMFVSYCFYFYLSRKMRKEEIAVPLHHSNSFHQVMVYLTLFISGIAISYQVMGVVEEAWYYGFTGVALFKLLVLLVVFTCVFGYYLTDLKKVGDMSHSKIALVFWWGVGALMLASMIGGVLVVGSPSDQKGKRFDETRISDLQSIQSDIDDQFDDTNRPLPETLSEFYNDEYLNELHDPEFNQVYQYVKTGNDSYKLCDSFGSSSDMYMVKLRKVYGGNAENTTDVWAHDKGYKCFEFTITRPGNWNDSEATAEIQ